MKIEDILNKLIKSYDNNKNLKDKYNEDTMRFVLNTEETEILLNYIADLQRKEYNNSKAIEYIENNFDFQEIRTLGADYEGTYKKSLKVVDLINILNGGDDNE